MTRPFKKSGFRQGIYEISATAKETVGTLRILADGRKFRYAKAGSSALGQGKISAAAAIAADVTDEACASAHAIGDIVIAETITSATYAENYFKGGAMHINDATGEGYSYPIESSTAVAAGTAITITLEEPIKVALAATTTQFTLAHSPWMATVETSDEENLPVGIPPVAVTAAYYYWSQTGGPALGLVNGTPAVGSHLIISGTTAGAFDAVTTPLDIDVPNAAIAWGTVGVSTEYKPVFLIID